MTNSPNIFDRFPSEIWANIMGLLSNPEPQPPPLSGVMCESNDRPSTDIVSLSRTCRAVHDNAVRALWRHVSIEDDAELQRVLDAATFRLFEEQTTTLGSLIRHLDLPRSVNWHGFQELLRECINLRQLHAWKPSSIPAGQDGINEASLNALAKLTDLGFSDRLRSPLFTVPELARLSRNLPNLRTLSVPRLDSAGDDGGSSQVAFSLSALTTLRLGSRRAYPVSTPRERRLLRQLADAIVSSDSPPKLRQLYVLQDLGDISALIEACGAELHVLVVYMDCNDWGTHCTGLNTVVLSADHFQASLPAQHRTLRRMYVRSPPQYVDYTAPTLHFRDMGDFLDEILAADFPALSAITFCGGYWSAEGTSTIALNELVRRGIDLVYPDESARVWPDYDVAKLTMIRSVCERRRRILIDILLSSRLYVS